MSTQELQPARSQPSFNISTVALPLRSQQPIPDVWMPSRGVSLNWTPSVASSCTLRRGNFEGEGHNTQQHSAVLVSSINTAPERRFNCVFKFAGCKTTFVGKVQWKRHVETQHLLLNYWLCTEGDCAANPFPLNRKDSFVQHLERRHAPEEIKHLRAKTSKATSAASAALTHWEHYVCILESAAIHPRCAPPISMPCPALECRRKFYGANVWDQYMEHVAQHMADGEDMVFEKKGLGTLVEWASRSDVAVIEPGEEGRGWVLKLPLRGLPGGNVVVTAPMQQVAKLGSNHNTPPDTGVDRAQEHKSTGVVINSSLTGCPVGYLVSDATSVLSPSRAPLVRWLGSKKRWRVNESTQLLDFARDILLKRRIGMDDWKNISSILGRTPDACREYYRVLKERQEA